MRVHHNVNYVFVTVYTNAKPSYGTLAPLEAPKGLILLYIQDSISETLTVVSDEMRHYMNRHTNERQIQQMPVLIILQRPHFTLQEITFNSATTGLIHSN